MCCTGECHFKTEEKRWTNNNHLDFTNIAKSKLTKATCVPWNYCSDPVIFCKHKEYFCPNEIEENEIYCAEVQKQLATETVVSSTMATVTTTNIVLVTSTKQKTISLILKINDDSTHSFHRQLIYWFFVGIIGIIFLYFYLKPRRAYQTKNKNRNNRNNRKNRNNRNNRSNQNNRNNLNKKTTETEIINEIFPKKDF